MISAWGVDHGISKAFRKLSPKLLTVDRNLQHGNPVGRSQSMEGRLKENYSQWRGSAGETGSGRLARMMGKPGASTIASARGAKAGATAMVTAAGNRSKRAGRYLP